MAEDNRLSKVMVIFLGITLLGSSFTAFSIPAFASGPPCNGKSADEWEALGYTKFVGTNGDDDIDGTSGNDVIISKGGNDDIDSKEGDDIICSGNGDDNVYSGPGDDFIDAGNGNNYVQAGDGNNYITLGSGDNTIQAGSGDDIIFAGSGNNNVQAGDGNNEITTGSGDDTIQAGSGDDCVDSGSGSDSIDAGSGTNLVDVGVCGIVDDSPTINIPTPADGSSYVFGTLVNFTGTAIDSEDGPLHSNISWISDIDGVLGIGGPPFKDVALSIGTHTITASVTDSGGNTASKSITIIISAAPDIGSPTITLTSPSDGDSFLEGALITLSGNAFDPEDGDLSSSIIWDSDIHGFIDIGASISSSTVPLGTHVITATVTDSEGNSVSKSITISVGVIVEDPTTLICHYPPGNPENFHEIMIAPSALLAHKAHGDKVGKCSDSDEERIELIKIKEHKKEIRDKNELKEKRAELKEIKKDLNDLKKEFTGVEKQKIKELVEEIKDVIKKLNENPEYDKEFKKLLKDEIKETKLEIKQEMTTKEKAIKHKIDSKVHSLSKSDNPQRDAKKLGFDFKDGKTKVAIKLSDDNPEIVDYLSSIGTVDVKNDKHVQLTVKVSDLPKLNSIGGIDKIRAPFPAVQFYEELSEGVYFINADLVQFAGITGEGIKAAVLDLAFTDNKKITDNVVQVKSFRQGIGYLPIQGNEGEASHGTAVAEIIADVAPDVELYLYSMETDIEFISAVDEAISQEVDVIAMSAGWPNFPTDGSSHITQKIEEAVENGIVFVVPSGNFANKHWEGNFVDANSNNWHDYTESDEGLSIPITKERIAEEKPIVSYLMWDVGMGDVADFEMVLVDPLGQIVDYSANEQKTKSDTPFEYIHHIPDTEGTYSIGVLYAGDISDISKRPKASLEIFSVNDEMEHPVTLSSVSVPADAEGAIVVGAVNHLDGTLEPFSSQGPTNNGKLAPHVVGPDGVTTLALGDKPFFGTSATTPYVAGIAALILQSNPDMSPEQVLNEIQQNTDQSVLSIANGYDYTAGYGSASAFFLLEDLEVIG